MGSFWLEFNPKLKHRETEVQNLGKQLHLKDTRTTLEEFFIQVTFDYTSEKCQIKCLPATVQVRFKTVLWSLGYLK